MGTILKQHRMIAYRKVWIIAGTGEGPILAKSLINNGWSVSVSVVTNQASYRYKDLPLQDLWIGPLAGPHEIMRILWDASREEGGFDFVIDLTHPFSLVISSYLKRACIHLGQPLLRYERKVARPANSILIKDIEELVYQSLVDKNILFAIGIRELSKATSIARKSGANVFARIFPRPDSLVEALSCAIPTTNLAVFRPEKTPSLTPIEEALCEKWSIDVVICRQSGGIIQEIWEQVCEKQKIQLFLIQRPFFERNVEVFESMETLLARVLP